MPFGLHGAPATFQRLMDIVLEPCKAFARAYLDDIVISSDSWEELQVHLKRTVRYPGHQIGNVETDSLENKFQAVQDFPLSVSKREIHSFIGMAAYYQRFIKNFAEIAESLTSLLKKGSPNKLKLNEIQDVVFENLKRALIETHVLATPDFSEDFVLQTDTSHTGVGGVLTQRDGEEQPIAFHSKKLVPAETRYSTVEKEALALK
ncbi:hypothetical protein QYM36_016716 [Artemia franciscana]|uniref:RNA-directed DNA polymerase n=1 Tax=Artemia franciscana TaxID=6661 RepID=A0AA88KVZ4_ARTSF|nr:hypothetical protein QYM36_016716 [Artemia franciscana]